MNNMQCKESGNAESYNNVTRNAAAFSKPHEGKDEFSFTLLMFKNGVFFYHIFLTKNYSSSILVEDPKILW